VCLLKRPGSHITISQRESAGISSPPFDPATRVYTPLKDIFLDVAGERSGLSAQDNLFEILTSVSFPNTVNELVCT